MFLIADVTSAGAAAEGVEGVTLPVSAAIGVDIRLVDVVARGTSESYVRLQGFLTNTSLTLTESRSVYTAEMIGIYGIKLKK